MWSLHYRITTCSRGITLGELASAIRPHSPLYGKTSRREVHTAARISFCPFQPFLFLRFKPKPILAATSHRAPPKSQRWALGRSVMRGSFMHWNTTLAVSFTAYSLYRTWFSPNSTEPKRCSFIWPSLFHISPFPWSPTARNYTYNKLREIATMKTLQTCCTLC
jgi:hypothetical protein